MKSVKMIDIAREANVSTATVSYILNNVKNQKISDETRNRVLKACEDLGYVPNLTAQALAGKKSRLIGILHVWNFNVENPWRNFTYCNFLNQISTVLSKNGYHTLFANVDISNPELNMVLQRKLDGVILLDVGEDMFYNISNVFHVPMMIVDGYLDDALFHKIVLDYGGAMEEAKEILGAAPDFVIAESSNNQGVVDKITEYAGVGKEDLLFASTEDELAAFVVKHQGQKGIVLNEFIGLFARRCLDPEDFVTICTTGSADLLPRDMKRVLFQGRKAQIVADLILAYLGGDYSDSDSKYTIIR